MPKTTIDNDTVIRARVPSDLAAKVRAATANYGMSKAIREGLEMWLARQARRAKRAAGRKDKAR